MKKLIPILSAVVLYSSFSAQQVYSDDIEVYTGSSGSVRGNVLLILDTSRSMTAWAIPPGSSDIAPYDNTIVYDNDKHGFDPDAYYIFRENDIIDNLDNIASDLINYKINPDTVLCNNAISTLDSIGSVNGKFLYWLNGQGWTGPTKDIDRYGRRETPPSVGTSSSSIIDCESNSYDYQGNNYDYLSNTTYEPYTDNRWRRSGWFGWTSNVIDWNNAYYTDIYKGNYLNYLSSPTTTNTEKMRIDVAVEAAVDVIQSTSNINVSLMRFSSNNEGGFVDIPMGKVEDVSNTFKTTIESYDAIGGTPIEETLYEAYQYLTGGTVEFGVNSKSEYFTSIGSGSSNGRDNNANTDDYGIIKQYSSSTTNTPSVSGSRKTTNTAKYQAPDMLECTPSKIILFSDGAPSADDAANSKIKSLIANYTLESGLGLDRSCSGDGACAEELANYMANTDSRPNDVAGTQIITVDTFGGFITDDTAKAKLEAIAKAGHGNYYEGSDYQKIREGLAKAVKNVITNPATFTSPTVAVNSFNSLESSDELYFSVFEPSSTLDWKGNLKRYKIGSDGSVLDVNDKPAVDDGTGFFSNSAQSYWSNIVDGPNVDQGGAASRLTLPRNIFTVVDSKLTKLSGSNTTLGTGGLAGIIPSTTKNLLSDDVLGISKLENLDSDYRSALQAWIIGVSEDGTPRTTMEDPLHSQPVVINYGQDDSTIFIATNSGYVHAFSSNKDNPKEYFSLIPFELLQNPSAYFSPQLMTSTEKRYGLDGAMTYWHNDLNRDGIVNGQDTLYLYIGMRRGGHSYYALDVTNRDAPKLLWQINGEYNNLDYKNIPSVTSGFESLGQTWSALTPADVRWDGKRRVVLFAGGGYDSVEDGDNASAVTKRQANSKGNTIYMLDAETGKILWDAKKDATLTGSMTNGIAAKVIPIDRDGNGYTDLLYATDLGGRIWRFDFSENATSKSNFAKGGVIADINDDTVSGNRRFYNAPDISYFTDIPNDTTDTSSVNNEFILLSVGSGYRAHPLNSDVTDYHFLIMDRNAKNIPEKYEAITIDDLVKFDGTNNADARNVSKGWYVPLQEKGEKVLSRSITLQGNIFFTTFTPNDPDLEVFCGGDTGKGRLYSLNIYNSSIEVTNVETPGIASDPVVVFPGEPPQIPEVPEVPNNPDIPIRDCESSSAVVLVGPTAIKSNINSCDILKQEYWKEEQ
jgi:type IV pilus assembly protein PilY1